MPNRVSAKGHELKGKAKDLAGKATKDSSLQIRGKGQQVKAHATGAVADMKKAARKTKNAVTR
jgi:uncharacterized protein YjbJ (UPF0337 family)